MTNNSKEITVALLMVAIALLLLNPLHFWMPDVLVAGMLVVALVLFGIFASFILREESVDEREDQHKAVAGRNAFLIGAGILMLGIAAQGYAHAVDPWLVVALVGMVITKLATRRWSDTHL